MKSRYVLHPDEGYADFWLEGGVTLLDFAEFIQKAWEDPRWKAEYDGIMDFSAATIELTDVELQKLLKSMLGDARCSLARWAFVVRTADTFGWLRKVDVLSAQQATLRIFFSRGEAERWFHEVRKDSRTDAKR
jgi:hypothetical protein